MESINLTASAVETSTIVTHTSPTIETINDVDNDVRSMDIPFNVEATGDDNDIVQDTVPVEAVRIDGGTQSRAELNQAAVAEYVDAIAAGQVLPPMVVFFDGAVFWLADGFHRYHAYAKAGVLDLPADIRTGTLRDAILFSVGANAAHGLRRTNEDKRRAVTTLLQDPEWSGWTDVAIGKACGVSSNFVGDMRRAIINPINDSSASATRTVTRNGKTYEQNTAKIGRPAAAAKTSKPVPATATAEAQASDNIHLGEQECPPSEEEIAEAIAAEQAERARIQAILDAGDPLAEALKKIATLERLLAAAEELLNSARHDNTLLVRQNKAMQAKLDRMPPAPGDDFVDF